MLLSFVSRSLVVILFCSFSFAQSGYRDTWEIEATLRIIRLAQEANLALAEKDLRAQTANLDRFLRELDHLVNVLDKIKPFLEWAEENAPKLRFSIAAFLERNGAEYYYPSLQAFEVFKHLDEIVRLRSFDEVEQRVTKILKNAGFERVPRNDWRRFSIYCWYIAKLKYSRFPLDLVDILPDAKDSLNAKHEDITALWSAIMLANGRGAKWSDIGIKGRIGYRSGYVLAVPTTSDDYLKNPNEVLLQVKSDHKVKEQFNWWIFPKNQRTDLAGAKSLCMKFGKHWAPARLDDLIHWPAYKKDDVLFEYTFSKKAKVAEKLARAFVSGEFNHSKYKTKRGAVKYFTEREGSKFPSNIPSDLLLTQKKIKQQAFGNKEEAFVFWTAGYEFDLSHRWLKERFGAGSALVISSEGNVQRIPLLDQSIKLPVICQMRTEIW